MCRSKTTLEFESYLYANETNTFITSYYFAIYIYIFRCEPRKMTTGTETLRAIFYLNVFNKKGVKCLSHIPTTLQSREMIDRTFRVLYTRVNSTWKRLHARFSSRSVPDRNRMRDIYVWSQEPFPY